MIKNKIYFLFLMITITNNYCANLGNWLEIKTRINTSHGDTKSKFVSFLRQTLDRALQKREQVLGPIKPETQEKKQELIQRYKNQIFPEQEKFLRRICAHTTLNVLLYINCLRLLRDPSPRIRIIGMIGVYGVCNWEFLWNTLDYFGTYDDLQKLDNTILKSLDALPVE